MKGQRFILAAILAVASTITWAADGNAEAAKQKISMCVGCHGIPGYRTAFPSVYHVPKLGGQHPDYIIAALKAYKDGSRKHPSMTGIAASLSDQDMADLAAYYGGAQ